MSGVRTRSWLFVPGDRPERFAKAAAAGADAVICDLEDAVGVDAKDRARDAVAAWLATGQAYVRINGVDTPWYADDLAAVGATAGLLGVILPKTASAGDVDAAASRLPDSTPVLPLIESAGGVQDVEAIAAAPRTRQLLFGSIDLRVDLGLDDSSGPDDSGEEALLYARSRLVVASRAAGRPAPVDGVTTALDDPELVTAAARRARSLGFGGKLCIHPRQIAPVHAAFAPTAVEIAQAERLVAAADAAHGSAVRLDGEMIDTPRIVAARRLLDGHRGA